MSMHDEQFTSFGDVECVPLSKFQKIVARRLSHSVSTIPHVTHHDEVDITDLDAYRRTIDFGVKVSPLIFVIKAVVEGLRRFPAFNSSLSEDGTTLVMKKYFHIGIAVDGPLGLLVPVLRDCDGKSIEALARELAALTAQARNSGLPLDAMSGGCMSISSLGGIGGTGFTPIINSPEVAILGITRAQTRPIWSGNAFVPRQILPLSLSYDHRVINGADASRFVRTIGDLLADPAALAEA